MARGRILIRRTIESNDPTQTPIIIPTIALTVTDIVNTIANVLIVASQAIGKLDVESLGRAVTPWLVVGQTGPADIHHGAIACRRIGFTPA
jgi:hypothetical protein